jgi:hypothetical protein
MMGIRGGGIPGFCARSGSVATNRRSQIPLSLLCNPCNVVADCCLRAHNKAAHKVPEQIQCSSCVLKFLI